MLRDSDAGWLVGLQMLGDAESDKDVSNGNILLSETAWLFLASDLALMAKPPPTFWEADWMSSRSVKRLRFYEKQKNAVNVRHYCVHMCLFKVYQIR